MANKSVTDQSHAHYTLTAELLRDFQVLVIIDPSQQGKGHGPWSLMIDEPPESGSSGVGPSPVKVALAALAA